MLPAAPTAFGAGTRVELVVLAETGVMPGRAKGYTDGGRVVVADAKEDKMDDVPPVSVAEVAPAAERDEGSAPSPLPVSAISLLVVCECCAAAAVDDNDDDAVRHRFEGYRMGRELMLRAKLLKGLGTAAKPGP